MPKISVIIPVYNTENYLRKCLDSVCNQTLSDIEIICINDCSTDGSLEILKEYASTDSRIKLIDFKENKGAAVARNTGIDEAQGEYIGFVDSDDFIDLDFYEKLYKRAVETNADAVKGNYKDAQTGYVDFSLNEKIKEDKNNFAFAYCSAIFKKKIIDDYSILFPLLMDMEDPVFTLQFALKANKVLIDDSACVNIVKRNNSLSNRTMSLKQLKDKFKGFEQIIHLLNASNIKNETYTFVASFWLWQTYANSIKYSNKGNCEYIARRILDLFNLINLKEQILLMLNKYSELFSSGLKNKDLISLSNCIEKSPKEKIFSALRTNLKKRLTVPKVSVIIPVYNAKDYLRRCLDSVCNQTLKDIEIICVNDCSTDNSIDILNEYARKYPNMKVIDCKVNGGESVARNIGLDNAMGEYLGFVDNDDAIDLDFYEKLYNKAIKTNADIVKGNVKTIDYNGKIKESEITPKILNTNNKWYFHYEWWSAIYRRDLIKKNSIKLLERYVLGADSLFLVKAISKCRNFTCVPNVNYYYYRRIDSGDSLILTDEKISSSLEIFSLIFNIINQCYKDKSIIPELYIYLCTNYIELAISYLFRTNSETSKIICCKYILKFVNICLEEDKILTHILEKHTSIYQNIKDRQLTSLIQFINKINTSKDYERGNLLAKLRYNVKRGQYA